ncbi:DUF4861 family protein [Wenyingzhuangia sp. IMCC45574]
MKIKVMSCKVFNKGVLLLFVGFMSCKAQQNIIVENNLDMVRSSEVIALSKSFLNVKSLNGLGLQNQQTGNLEVIQLVDVNGDGVQDELLFQPTIQPNSKATFTIVAKAGDKLPTAENLCYSRFVPERTDDYTWENDKVAFRVFGPTAQKMKEDHVKGGTLSSGVDAWLKRVSYPIINKWYKKTLVDKTGSYHEDTGEGLDNFHVGVSRGVGGLAVKDQGAYFFSKNYTAWRTITTGPLRTSFYLKYADWKAGDKTITEYKVITLDKGNNLSKVETFVTGTSEISVGLTLHKKKGKVEWDVKQGWMSYWEPLQDSELGTGIVAAGDVFLNQETYDVDKKDLSNAYADLKVVDKKVTYYTGFGWKKAGEFTNQQQWNAYLKSFKEKLNSPLKVTLE